MEDKSWFEIDTKEYDVSEPTVINEFYEINCEWIKIEVIDINSIEKILYRN